MAKSATMVLPRAALRPFPAGKYMEAEIVPPNARRPLFQAVVEIMAANLGESVLGG
jgi:hypothetical protein